MKDNEQNQQAVALDLPNGNHAGVKNHIYYGDQNVPHPCNHKAMKVEPAKVMKQVMEGR